MIQGAIVKALTELTSFNPVVLETLKTLISTDLRQGDGGEDIYAAQLRLRAIEGELAALIELESQDDNQGNYEAQIDGCSAKKACLWQSWRPPRPRNGTAKMSRPCGRKSSQSWINCGTVPSNGMT